MNPVQHIFLQLPFMFCALGHSRGPTPTIFLSHANKKSLMENEPFNPWQAVKELWKKIPRNNGPRVSNSSSFHLYGAYIKNIGTYDISTSDISNNW